MSVQLDISYETLFRLIDQLPDAQQDDLLRHLLDKAKTCQLSKDERLALFDSLTVDLGAVPRITPTAAKIRMVMTRGKH